MLNVINITKTYHSGDIDIVALNNVSFDVADGEMVSVIGKADQEKRRCLI